MPIITTGTGIAIGCQIISSVYTQKYNKKNTAEIKRLQEEHKKELLLDGQTRDWAKFQRACERQKESELESHRYRMEKIDQSFENSFRLDAYSSALSKWPLNINPYFIKNGVLSFNRQEVIRKELFCILTNSNKDNFNNNIFPTLENELNNYISSYWNARSSHTICFYSNMWKRDRKFCDNDVLNLQAILPVPMLVVSPYFEDNQDNSCEICFKLNFWGIGDKDQTIKFVPDNLSVKFKKNELYTPEERFQIISELIPPLVCMIGYFIDNYYWAYYYEKPIMPSLLASGELFDDKHLLNTYKESYKQMYELCIKGKVSKKNTGISNDEIKHIKDIAEINQFTFPKRGLDLIDGIKEIVLDNDLKEMLDNASQILRKSRTTEKNADGWKNHKDFNKFDIDYLNKLEELGKDILSNTEIDHIKDVLKYFNTPDLFYLKNINSVNWTEFSSWINQEKSNYHNAAYFCFKMLSDQILVGAFLNGSSDLIFYEDKEYTCVYGVTLCCLVEEFNPSECFYHFDISEDIIQLSDLDDKIEIILNGQIELFKQNIIKMNRNKKILTGLNHREYEHPDDKEALIALEKTPGLKQVGSYITKHTIERMYTIQFTGSNIRVTKQNYPLIYEMLEHACHILNIPRLPDLYLQWGYNINGFTTGAEKPLIVLNSGVIDLCDDDEKLFIIGHECGHIKSMHMLYHMMAQVINSIINFIPGGEIFASSLQYALFYWSRMSEYTADRAGLLCCQDKDAAIRALMKMAGMPMKHFLEMDYNTFIDQAKEFDQLDFETLNKVVKFISIMDASHPWTVKRAAELLKWIDKGAYDEIINEY